jgi:hypothetical protein
MEEMIDAAGVPRTGVEPLQLDGETLVRDAEQRAGSGDWGFPPFREALDRLLHSARTEAQLSGEAAARFATMIGGLLVKRLNLYADRARHPEIARQEIVAPIVVTGLPRSGTTILHSLLAQDPSSRSPLRWEVERPSPPPRADTFDTDPRIALSQADVDRLPETFRAMHAMGAELPEEDNSIQTMAFLSSNFGAQARLPSYMHWLIQEADVTPAFQLHRHVLQHLQAFAPRERWVLKAPPHLYWPEALLATYPDARIVVTHRDPADVLPSNASLIAYLRGADADGRRLAGQDQIDEWGVGLRRTIAYRASDAHADQFLDTLYADFMRDPIAVVRRVYDRFGLALTSQAEAAMRRFMADNRQSKHGSHDYDAGDYGLDRERLHAEFADYIATYAIPTR